MMEVADNVSYGLSLVAPLILGGHDFHPSPRRSRRPWSARRRWHGGSSSRARSAYPASRPRGRLARVGGIGIWGLNQPVGCTFDITNFVFWIVSDTPAR
jgi:hypothetical protein